MAYMTAPVAQRRGDAPALIDEYGRCSWLELDRRVNRLIRALRAVGTAAAATASRCSPATAGRCSN